MRAWLSWQGGTVWLGWLGWLAGCGQPSATQLRVQGPLGDVASTARSFVVRERLMEGGAPEVVGVISFGPVAAVVVLSAPSGGRDRDGVILLVNEVTPTAPEVDVRFSLAVGGPGRDSIAAVASADSALAAESPRARRRLDGHLHLGGTADLLWFQQDAADSLLTLGGSRLVVVDSFGGTRILR